MLFHCWPLPRNGNFAINANQETAQLAMRNEVGCSIQNAGTMKIRRLPGTPEDADYARIWAALQMCACSDRGAQLSACIGLRNSHGWIAVAIQAETDEEFSRALRCLRDLGFTQEAGAPTAGYQVVVSRVLASPDAGSKAGPSNR